jgi:hypothetical protein
MNQNTEAFLFHSFALHQSRMQVKNGGITVTQTDVNLEEYTTGDGIRINYIASIKIFSVKIRSNPTNVIYLIRIVGGEWSPVGSTRHCGHQ